MAMKAASFVRILQWAQELGWRATFRNLMAIALRRRERLLLVPGVSAKIRVRANDSDLVMFEQVFVRRDYEFDIGFEPTTIVDAGANAGYASLYFHRKYPEARITAIEPDSENCETLRFNTGTIPKIHALNAGLWSNREPLVVVDAGTPKCMISLKPAAHPGPGNIDGYGVCDIMRMMDTEVIDLLKLDIEGGELELFSANFLPWITKVRVIIIELHDRLRPGCAAAFYSAIRDLRFTQQQRGDTVMIVNEDLRPA
jgi:FkbM family methyltransferase